MSIISCHGFVNNIKSGVILSCRRILVNYYLSKYFAILETKSSALSNAPLRLNQMINSELTNKNDFAMACYIAIPSTDNTLKIITICYYFCTYFSSAYYNDKGGAIIYIFGEYIKRYIKKIGNPVLIEE